MFQANIKKDNFSRRKFLKAAGILALSAELGAGITAADNKHKVSKSAKASESSLSDNINLPMRIGIGAPGILTDDLLSFIKQLGVNDLDIKGCQLPGDKQWEYQDILALRKRVERYGLRLAVLENVPISFCDKAILGLPGRDEQIEHMINTINNIGKAGVPMLGYNWMVSRIRGKHNGAMLRGGALARSFDLEDHKDLPLSHGKTYTRQRIWNNYNYYMERILPAAEKAKVKLALHPDDPPVESLEGAARIFGSFDSFKMAMSKFDSPFHGLNFCVGTWSSMNPQNVFEAIRYFGKKIFYVHLRFVKGQVPNFKETFINEGSIEPFEVIKALKKVGFKSFVIPDHIPTIINDTQWGHLGRAHAVGYITAMIDIANKMK